MVSADSNRLYSNQVDENDYRKLLLNFSQFDYCNTDEIEKFDFTYEEWKSVNRMEYIESTLSELKHKSEMRTFVNTMLWIDRKLNGNGNCNIVHPITAIDILKRTESLGVEANCYMYAVVLTELLLMLGFKARTVRCMPIDIRYDDCHCMTEVFSQEYDKWIALDAANRSYYLKRAMPLNLFEMRECLMKEEKIIVPFMKSDIWKGLRGYLTKNMFRFETYRNCYVGSEEKIGERCLCHFQSENYMFSEKKVAFKDYYVHHVYTSNPNIFWKKPK